MRIFRNLADAAAFRADAAQAPAVALSAFDGLHLGHRRLLDLVAGPVPWAVLHDPPGAAPRLSARRQCFEFFAARAVDVVVVWRDADERSGDVLQLLAPETLLVGAGDPVPDALGGADRVRVVAAVEEAGGSVSSRALREAVAASDLDRACAMRGTPYAVSGRVVHGFHRGASIGVPTANLRVRGQLLPPDGVYAVTVGGACSGVGVANLGRNPTFGNDERSLETNIFDFEADLYGRRLEIGFVRRLRGEKKFDGVDALVEQIHRDIDAARAIHSDASDD